MDGSSAALARCIGDVDRFLAQDWGRRPRHVAGADSDAFGDLLPLGDVDRIIATMALRAPAFRLVRDGVPVPERAYLRSARVGSRPISDLIDPGRVGALFAEGATIVLQGVQRYWPPVTDFCRQLEQALTHAVQANAYITPPGSSGFDVHADRHDVFALQTHGRKRWVVYPPGPADDGEGEEWDLELAPGDCLYLPTGVRHAAQTIGHPSVHLTVGVRHTTWRDVLRQAVDEALDDAAFDEPLPAGFAAEPAMLSDGIRSRLEAVADALGTRDPHDLADGAAASFWASRMPALTGHLADILDLDDITGGTPLLRRSGAVCHVRSREGRAEMVLGDRVVSFPLRLHPVLEKVAAADRLRADDLSADLDASGRLVLCRRLVREGLLTVDRG